MYPRRAITRGLSFSFTSPFLFVFHVDKHKHESSCRRSLVYTRRPKDGKIRRSPSFYMRTTGKTISTFSLDDNITEVELSGIPEGDITIIGPRARGGCASRGRTEKNRMRQRCDDCM